MSVYPTQRVSAMRDLINYLGSTLFCRVRVEENKIRQREVTSQLPEIHGGVRMRTHMRVLESGVSWSLLPQ